MTGYYYSGAYLGPVMVNSNGSLRRGLSGEVSHISFGKGLDYTRVSLVGGLDYTRVSLVEGFDYTRVSSPAVAAIN